MEISANGNSVTVPDDLDAVKLTGNGNTVISQGAKKKDDKGTGNTIA